MRRRIAVVGLTASLAGLGVLPQQADAVTATTLYVNKMSGTCSDSGNGTQAAPYCTIQAAANAAAAGDTVKIFGGAANAVGYGSVTITHSGTAAAPITFEAIGRYVNVGTLSQPVGVTISGAAYVNLVGFATTLNIANSAHVTVSDSGIGTLNVQKGSSAVTIERDNLTALTVAAGVSGTDIAANIIRAYGPGSGVSVVGAAGTDIVNNSIEIQPNPGLDASGISVTGGASGTTIENNILSGAPVAKPEMLVDASSAAGTTEGYNVFHTTSSSDVYSWAGNGYATVADFQTASGQGASDVLDGSFSDATSASFRTSDASAIGSANVSAPGRPATDYYGHAWTEADRGAVVLTEYTGATLETMVDQQSVDVNIDFSGLLVGPATVTLNWGDGSATDTALSGSVGTIFTDGTDNQQLHQYTSVGTYPVVVKITDAAGTKTLTTNVTTGGSTYVPVAPKRVLDTRNATGVSSAGTIAAGHSVAFNVINGVTGAPAASEISAVVLNVTVTGPAAGGFVSAYPDGTAVPKSSNVNFSKGETVPNLTTVMVGQDGKVDLYTSATTHLVADVEGYYVAAASGGGYHPISPIRLLDTRKGTGAPAAPVGPGKSITLKVAGNGAVPASGLIAAAMNVTVTGPVTGGVITVFPAGGSTPNTSNVNYVGGETVANMAIVKLGTNGAITFTNSSAGTVQIVADISGYYTATGGDGFVPMAPWRALDTRNGTGQETPQNRPVAPNSAATWFFDDEFQGSGYWSGDSMPAGVVLNVTVTQPVTNGDLVAFPAGGTVPTASNINFSAGETVPNMVMAACDKGGSVSLYNQSTGQIQVVADVFGYFS